MCKHTKNKTKPQGQQGISRLKRKWYSLEDTEFKIIARFHIISYAIIRIPVVDLWSGDYTNGWYSKREYIEYSVNIIRHANVMLVALSLLNFLSSIFCYCSDFHMPPTLQSVFMPPTSVCFQREWPRTYSENGAPEAEICFIWYWSQNWCLIFWQSYKLQERYIHSCQWQSHRW